jgi:hypothetical protein
MDEIQKKNKFRRLLNSRMTRAIQQIRLIGNLSDKRHYAYSEKQIQLIKKTLDDEIKSTIGRFNLAGKQKSKTTFNIDELE